MFGQPHGVPCLKHVGVPAEPEEHARPEEVRGIVHERIPRVEAARRAIPLDLGAQEELGPSLRPPGTGKRRTGRDARPELAELRAVFPGQRQITVQRLDGGLDPVQIVPCGPDRYLGVQPHGRAKPGSRDLEAVAGLPVTLVHLIGENLELEEIVLADGPLLVSLGENRVGLREPVQHLVGQLEQLLAQHDPPIELPYLEAHVGAGGFEPRVGGIHPGARRVDEPVDPAEGIKRLNEAQIDLREPPDVGERGHRVGRDEDPGLRELPPGPRDRAPHVTQLELGQVSGVPGLRSPRLRHRDVQSCLLDAGMVPECERLRHAEADDDGVGPCHGRGRGGLGMRPSRADGQRAADQRRQARSGGWASRSRAPGGTPRQRRDRRRRGRRTSLTPPSTPGGASRRTTMSS